MQPAPKNIIEIIDLVKTYNRLVLDDKHTYYTLNKINLAVAAGDIYGIMGPSGAGKSTLLRCLIGLIKPTAGSIKINGQDINIISKAERRQFYNKIGMVFQHVNLFAARTVAGNISYPLEIFGVDKKTISVRVAELLALVGLTDKAQAYPSQLSGGEKQRVGIARALANAPSILFCDEASSALDPKTTQEILTLLKNINTKLGVTIVLITHEMAVIKQICNKIAVLANGMVVETGNVVDVFFAPRSPITQQLLQSSAHELPPEIIAKASATQLLLRLRFKGNVSQEPIIAILIKRFTIDVNILQGWIDNVQNTMLGTLVVEFSGTELNIQQALSYLHTQSVHYECIDSSITATK